jgi:actin-related protein 5
VLGACCRTNVGGSHITDFLRQLLSLKYPYHAYVSAHFSEALYIVCFPYHAMSNISNFTFNRGSVTWDKAEELKKEHCYIALDYMSELQIFKVRKLYR